MSRRSLQLGDRQRAIPGAIGTPAEERAHLGQQYPPLCRLVAVLLLMLLMLSALASCAGSGERNRGSSGVAEPRHVALRAGAGPLWIGSRHCDCYILGQLHGESQLGIVVGQVLGAVGVGVSHAA